MAACCGVPPYTPDQLMEIVVTESTVSTRVGHRPGPAPPPEPARGVRPGRLGPGPAGRARQRRGRGPVPGPGQAGPGPRRRGDRRRAGHAGPAAAGAATPWPPGDALAISYYSASTDRVTEREIAPLRLFASRGPLVRRRLVRGPPATCAGSGSTASAQPRPWRRVPRPTVPATRRGQPTPTGRPRRTADLEPFVPGPDSRRVRLSIDPSAAWLVESIPSAGPPESVDGRIELEVFVGGEAWLERLLLRLGPDARWCPEESSRGRGAPHPPALPFRVRGRPDAAAWSLPTHGQRQDT